jgi:hypothetical protein
MRASRRNHRPRILLHMQRANLQKSHVQQANRALRASQRANREPKASQLQSRVHRKKVHRSRAIRPRRNRLQPNRRANRRSTKGREAVHNETKWGGENSRAESARPFLFCRSMPKNCRRRLLVRCGYLCARGSQRGRDGRRSSLFEALRQRRFQSELQHLIHGVDEVQLHRVAQILGNLG